MLQVAEGYTKVYMSEGLTALIVEDAAHLPDALRQLRESMQVLLLAIRACLAA